MKRKFLLGTVTALLTAVILVAAMLGNPPRQTPLAATASATAPGKASPESVSRQHTPARADPPADGNASALQLLQLPSLQPGNAETRLIEIFSLVETGQVQEALQKSSTLTRDHPNFQLAQLVHGDLLRLRFQPSAASALGNVSDQQAQAAAAQLAALRTESRKRLNALQHRPPEGTIPSQFVALSDWTRHAIAIDASHSRLYLFENKPVASQASGQAMQLTLVADFFISVGKAGIGKLLEGDNRTPLGVYYITSVKERKTLPPFYGAGALPINYPNAFDVHVGRTGGGIWLHGTPPEQFVRATLASEGCVVLSNPDLQTLLNTVAPRTTPVVISEQLNWVEPHILTKDRQAFEGMLTTWLHTQHPAPAARAALGFQRLSLLQAHQPETGLVATFEETLNGTGTGNIRRQYWMAQSGQWQLLQDTLLAGASATAQPKPAQPRTDTAATTPITTAAASTAAASKPAKPSPAATAAPEPKTSATKADKIDKAERPEKADKASARATEEAVRAAVQAWARAWSQKNMAAYLKAYDASFAAPGGLTRKAWETERKDRITSKGTIQVTLTKVSIQVQGNTATARFVQTYRADPLNVSSRKTLKLIQRGNQWLIKHEQVGAG